MKKYPSLEKKLKKSFFIFFKNSIDLMLYECYNKCIQREKEVYIVSDGIKIDTKISQVGNSLGVIIPGLFCNVLKLEKGTQINIELQSDKIIIRKEEK
jgi:hypothetical protein